MTAERIGIDKWERRILGVLELGGGFVGLAMGGMMLMQDGLLLSKLLSLPLLAVYALGMVCGIRTLEPGRPSRKASLVFWALQVPLFSSPLASYFLGAGAMAYVHYNFSESGFGAFAIFGSRFEYSLLQDKPWVLGINLFAVAVVVWLLRRHLASPPAIVVDSPATEAAP